ncbi:MAG: metallophosphatase family protein [Eubacterium sp.]|nr:metallophosphatase family protein [Eubacterium sp.]MCM1303238.1 metallophosphatase family protein [Butyrivibrio sp.]MCM1343203.1 metallophosphatase family protein [Muribaculaceae bacterium]MCM1409553.1 metallophosphatase family protein [Lachnospiraceae bacterium]
MEWLTRAHRVAVISDTHGLLRPECVRVLETCEAILHAGDVGKPEILSRLREIAQTYAVRGNVDQEWAEELPMELETELYGFRFYMVHNKKYIRAGLSDADFVICGHSHKYEEKTERGITYLNPGSCGPRRFRLPVTMMALTLFPEEHRFEVERIDCLPRTADVEMSGAFPQKEMDRLIRRIIKEMKVGKGVAEIAGKVGADRALVEQICRIYATHPGVDVDGILNRMELKDL